MSDQQPHPRPGQVTAAAVTAVVGCALLVVALFDAMAEVRSVERRDAIERLLAEPPFDGLGVSVAQMTSLLHWLVLLNGAVAAAAVVLGIFALQRHRGARLGLTIAAAVLLFTAPASGGVLPVVVAVAATLLWSRPARDWFDGRPPRPAGVAAAERDPAARPSSSGPPPGDRPGGQPADQPADQPGGQPGPETGPGQPPEGPPAAPYPFGQRPSAGAPAPAPWQPAAGHQPAGYPYAGPAQYGYGYPPAGYGGPRADRRPWTVTVAAALTWVFAGLAATAFAITMLALTVARDEVLRELERSPQFRGLDMSTGDFVAVVWAVSALVVLWSLVAAVLAVLAFRRLSWARIALAASAGMAALAGLLTVPVGALHLLAAAATVVLLFTGGANAWYAGRPTGWPGGPGPQPPYPGNAQPPYPGNAQPPYQGNPPPPYPGNPPAQGNPGGDAPPSGKPPVW